MQLSVPIRQAAVVLAIATCAAAAACSRPSGETARAATPSAAAPNPIPVPSTGNMLQPTDLYHLRSIGDVRVSPDASRIAYAVVNNTRSGRPYTQVWIMDVGSRPRARTPRLFIA